MHEKWSPGYTANCSISTWPPRGGHVRFVVNYVINLPVQGPNNGWKPLNLGYFTKFRVFRVFWPASHPFRVFLPKTETSVPRVRVQNTLKWLNFDPKMGQNSVILGPISTILSLILRGFVYPDFRLNIQEGRGPEIQKLSISVPYNIWARAR